MDKDYSNREIDMMFRETKESLAELKNILLEIKEQTTKTNGRVTRLEFWKEGLTAKVSGIVASITIAWILLKQFIFK